MEIIIILLAILITAGIASAVTLDSSAQVTVNPIYDLDLDTRIMNFWQLVFGANNIVLDIELQKTDLTNVSDPIDVELNYTIRKRSSSDFITISQGVLDTVIIDDFYKGQFGIPIPSSAGTGLYTLQIDANSPQAYGGSDYNNFLRIRLRI